MHESKGIDPSQDRSASNSGGALSGIRVIDFSQFLSGPFGSQILGDLGADVIKIEAPAGDLARHIPPHFVGEDSLYYLSVNRNKRSLGLNLKSAEGVAVARRLILESDVVLENFRPGVLARLGLSVEDFRKEKPSLIWCSISGFGQTGPYRNKQAYDMIVQALSGGMSMTGEPDGNSVRAGIPIGDLAAGMYAVIGILAALHRRANGGNGEYLDISMLDCQVALLTYQAAYHLHSGTLPGRQGSGHDSIPTYRAFTAADGREVVITANTERMWAGLCKALGRDDLVEDARFRTGKERYENRAALWPMLEAAFLERTADEWVPVLEAHDVPVGVINTLDRVVSDPQVRARNMILELAAGEGRAVRTVGSPLVGNETPREMNTYPPGIGENSVAILREIGRFETAEINRLIADGTVTVSNRGTA